MLTTQQLIEKKKQLQSDSEKMEESIQQMRANLIATKGALQLIDMQLKESQANDAEGEEDGTDKTTTG